MHRSLTSTPPRETLTSSPTRRLSPTRMRKSPGSTFNASAIDGTTLISAGRLASEPSCGGDRGLSGPDAGRGRTIDSHGRRVARLPRQAAKAGDRSHRFAALVAGGFQGDGLAGQDARGRRGEPDFVDVGAGRHLDFQPLLRRNAGELGRDAGLAGPNPLHPAARETDRRFRRAPPACEGWPSS